MGGNLHPGRGPGCYCISIICHKEITGEVAARNLEFGSVTNFACVQEIALEERERIHRSETLAPNRKIPQN